MFIFFVIVASIGYFMYRWYKVIKQVNLINANTIIGHGDDNVIPVAMSSLQQPCVTTAGDKTDNNAPFCDPAANLVCVTGMYEGNGVGTNTGVCMSAIGGYCDTLYDCTPSAHACINNICENLTETINLPCKYDSDCIGGVTCLDCKSGSGPCKDDEGNCYELQNGQCPSNGNIVCDLNPGNALEAGHEIGVFRYNHTCDSSLSQPLCKYDLSPKDQGCATDSDCVQPEGGAFCYKGSFLTDYNPNGNLVPPTYSISSVSNINNATVFEIDFSDTLLTVNSFEVGTEINFINSDVSRTTFYNGPYYLSGQYDNEYITISETKTQPNVNEYIYFENKYIELNYSQYDFGLSYIFNDITTISEFKIVFGKLPSMQILTNCYYVSNVDELYTFNIVDSDKNFTLSDGVNVENGVTEVRFRIVGSDSVTGDINQSPGYILNQANGSSFTVTSDLSSLKSYNSATNLIQVMFGNPVDVDTLNPNTGVCVMRLPPSANITTDSKYDLTKYNGNPCIELYDNSVSVSPINGFCGFTNYPSGPGSVCQFPREGVINFLPDVGVTVSDYDPLPCSSSSTVYEGITYELQCLLNDNLTGTLRNNPNFLNSSFAGVCTYPVHNKFKTCALYGNNCALPYVCTEFDGGYFCDSRFDVLQCNATYTCPSSFACVDGDCLSETKGFCVDNFNCKNLDCNMNSIHLAVYNRELNEDTSVTVAENKLNNVNNIIDLGPIGISGVASEYDLYVSSTYDSNNVLITYAAIHSDTLKVVKIIDPLNNPIVSYPSVSQMYEKIIFDHYSSTLYNYTVNTTTNTLVAESIYPSQSSPKSFNMQIPGTFQSLDIFNDKALVVYKTIIEGGDMEFTNTDIPNQVNIYESYLGDYYYYQGGNFTKLTKTIVNYYETKPSPPPSTSYIVNGTSTDNGFYSGDSDTLNTDADSYIFIVNFNFTDIYYIWNSAPSVFNEVQRVTVKQYDSFPFILPGENFIVTSGSRQGWYLGGTGVSLPIPSFDSPINKQRSRYHVIIQKLGETQTVFTLPFNPYNLDDMQECKFDLLEVNDSEMDIVCVYNPSNSQNPILGVRNKARSFTTNGNTGYYNFLLDSPQTCEPYTLGCFANPTVTLASVSTVPSFITDEIPEIDYFYLVSGSLDVNTIYTFSGSVIHIGNYNVERIYKNNNVLYLHMDGNPGAGEFDLTIISNDNYMPFSFNIMSKYSKYDNSIEKHLIYPSWITDLQDLIVGDNFNPMIERIFYQPNRINKNYYAIVNMYTGYDNPIEQKIVSQDQNFSKNNMYLFRFSSSENEMGLTVNETLPIRVYGETDIKRFSQCNQTQNMYFLTNVCN